MSSLFNRLIITSVRRRKQEVRRVTIIAALATFFVFLTVLFQDNLDLYQNRANQIKYGEWLFSETTQGNTESSNYLQEHAYFEGYGVMKKGAQIGNTGYFMGYADATILERGHISLIEGAMPQSQDEIVMELDVLAALGKNNDIGQKITISYQDSEGKEQTKDYTLCGILVNYSLFWNNGTMLPTALTTWEEFDRIGVVSNSSYLYLLKDDVTIENEAKFVEDLGKTVQEELIFNSNAAKSTIWGDTISYEQIIMILLIVSASALIYTYLFYVNQRKKEYYRYRCFGVNKSKLKRIVIFEGIYACVPGILIGLVAAFAGMIVLCLILKRSYETELLYAFPVKSILLCLLSVVATAFLAILLVMLTVNDRRIYDNTKGVPVKKLKRLRKSAQHSYKVHHIRNIYAKFRRREYRLHPLRSLFTLVLSTAVAIALLLCLNRIFLAYHFYQTCANRINDYSVNPVQESQQVQYSVNGKNYSIGWPRVRYDQTIDNQFFTDLQEIGLTKNVTRMTVDNSSIITWDGIEDSPIRELQLTNYNKITVPDDIKDQLYRYGSTFYEDSDSIYESLKDYIDPAYYDPDAFARGEQVIYETNNITAKAYDNGFNVTDYTREDTLEAGDTITYETEDGPVEAIVVAFVYEQNLQLYSASGEYAYEFIGSSELGQKVAASDHREFGYNKIYFNLKSGVSIKIANNLITNLFQKYGINYNTGIESKQNYRSYFYQRLFIFSLSMAIILSVYIVIYANMISFRMRYKERNLKRMKWLGASRQKLIRVELITYTVENFAILLALPVVILFNCYVVYKKIGTAEYGVWIGFLDQTTKQWSMDKVKYAIYMTLTSKVAVVWSVVALIVLFLILYLVALLPVVHTLRKTTEYERME